MPEWQSIDLPDSQAVRLASNYGHRLEVYWVEFNTNKPDERNDLLSFLMHPLASLRGDETESDDAGANVSQGTIVPGLSIDGVDETWRVITTIHNHHRGLNPRITRFMATVSDDEKTVYLEAHKQPDG
ncbi:MAG TPA: hypothetical protein VLA29_04785 [Acidimicrobiia bacterium]|nr:hypothetical protein [Acidimicrobiia bacterium]